MMSFSTANVEIVEIDRIEIAVEPWSWEFARFHRDEIDRYFACLQRERSELWNGRVLLLSRYAVRNGVLQGTCFETDYASFIAWRDWEFPDRSVHNFFAASALRAMDGGYLVGEMAQYTAGALQLCFPCGTPEPNDTVAGVVNLQTNLRRELLEETGIDLDELDADRSWTMVLDRGYVALIRSLRARCNADELRARVMRHLAIEAQPEFSSVRIVRGPDDLDARMPPHVIAFLNAAWGQ
jgi:hypothetical protein